MGTHRVLLREDADRVLSFPDHGRASHQHHLPASYVQFAYLIHHCYVRDQSVHRTIGMTKCTDIYTPPERRQRAERREQSAESREQRAESREQRAKAHTSAEREAKENPSRTTSRIAHTHSATNRCLPTDLCAQMHLGGETECR